MTGGHGDTDSREPVVGTEFVDSIVREKLEPLLHDFINNNSVSCFTSSNYDDQLTKYTNSRFNGTPGIGFKTKSNVVESSTAVGFSDVINTGVRITADSESYSKFSANAANITGKLVRLRHCLKISKC